MTCIRDNIHMYLYKKKPNFYNILNVNSSSSKEEIRHSYLRLSKIYHPDKCKDVHANELFNLITLAYNQLYNKNNNYTTNELVHSFLKDVVDKEYINLYSKMVLTPDNLSLKDIIVLGYSFYKMNNN